MNYLNILFIYILKLCQIKKRVWNGGLNKLIENSSDWARGGNETTGRAYGIIK